MLKHFLRRLLKMIKPDRFVCLDATVNAVPRSSGTFASLAKQSNKLLQCVITRMGECSSLHSSGKFVSPIGTTRNIARVYSASSRASRHALASVPKVDRMVRIEACLFQTMKNWNGFYFLQIVLSHHTYQHHTENGHGYPSALPRANYMSYFASLEFRLSYTELPLVGLWLEAYWHVRNLLSQTPSVLSQRQTSRFHIVRHSPNSLPTV